MMPSLLFDQDKALSHKAKSAPASDHSEQNSPRKRMAPSPGSAKEWARAPREDEYCAQQPAPAAAQRKRKPQASHGAPASQRAQKRPKPSSTGTSSGKPQAASQCAQKRPRGGSTSTSSRQRSGSSPAERDYKNKKSRIHKRFMRHFCLVPKVAKRVLDLLALDTAGQRALCGFEPCPRPTGPASFYKPVYSIGTGACHPGVPSLRGIRVKVCETVGTPKSSQPLKLGFIEELYLASADAPYYERTADAPSSSQRASTRFAHISPELFVNVKLETPFRGHALSGNLSLHNQSAARAHGRFFKLKSQVFMLRKTARAIRRGFAPEDIAKVDQETFDKVQATYERRLARAERERERAAQATGLDAETARNVSSSESSSSSESGSSSDEDA
jgi:hypothetical protein